MFKRLSTILRVPLPRLTKALEEGKDDPLTPILVKTAVHEDQVAYLKEHRAEFPGVEIVAHLPARLRVPDARRPGARLRRRDLAGGAEAPGARTAIAAARRSARRASKRRSTRTCAGTRGRRAAPGRLARPPAGRDSSRGGPRQPGNTVRLTIDVGLQRAAERAIRDGIELAHEGRTSSTRTAARSSRSTRATARCSRMASNPTYKPSVYVGRVDPKKLEPLTVEKVAKERNYPGINRAIAGVYPPGSTFKPLTALAAISDGLLSPYEYIQCTPSAEYGLDKSGVQELEPVHERADVADDRARAVVRHLLLRRRQPLLHARRARAQVLDGDAGAGRGSSASAQAPGLDIGGEAAGLAADARPGASDVRGASTGTRPGTRATLIQLAIGQKDITVTPLQMARFYAAIANGGKLVTPYIVSSIEQPEQRRLAARRAARLPAEAAARRSTSTRRRSPSCATGLYQATHDADGTSSGVFGSFPVPVAGKTGTAEKVVTLPGYPFGHLEDQAWWCGWGPFDGNEYVTSRGTKRAPIVVCAVIENGGHGGAAAAPAALKVFEHWFQEKAGVVQAASSRVIDYASSGSRGVRPASTSTSSASCAGSTGSCSARSPRSSPTGSGPSPGSRATTSTATRTTTSSARRSPPASASSGFLVALAIDPDRYRRAQKAHLRRDAAC